MAEQELGRNGIQEKRKAPFPAPFAVAGAGFEPATSGLCDLQLRPIDKLAHDEHSVMTAEAKAVAQRDPNG